jgi:hypothetical protein
MSMPYTMEDFKRDAAERLLSELTPEQRLKGLAPEQRLQGLSPEQLLSLVPFADVESFVKKHKPAHDKDAHEPPNTPS